MILRTLGKSFSYMFMSRKIQALWARKGKVAVWDIGHCHFIARFESEDDYKRAMYDGPWLVGDHYVLSEVWRPNFEPGFSQVNLVRVWVRLPGIPIENFDVDVLRIIEDKLGRMVRMDSTTLFGSRGNYARICIEVDLQKPLVSKYHLHRRVRRVEYEGLHEICFDCGCYGHEKKSCPTLRDPVSCPTSEHGMPILNPLFSDVEDRPEVTDDYGPWMKAKKNARRRNMKHDSKKPEVVNHTNPIRDSGSRFAIFEVADEVEDEESEKEEDTREGKEFAPVIISDPTAQVDRKDQTRPEDLARTNPVSDHVNSVNPQVCGCSNVSGTQVVTETCAAVSEPRPQVLGLMLHKLGNCSGAPPKAKPNRDPSKDRTPNPKDHSSGGSKAIEKVKSPSSGVSKESIKSDKRSPTPSGARLREVAAEFVFRPSLLFLMLKLFSWNCCGAGNERSLSVFKEYITEHKLNVVILVEPKISGSTADGVCRSLGFDKCRRVDSVGFAGGIWVAWLAGQIYLDVIERSDQFMHLKGHAEDMGYFFLTAVYGRPSVTERVNLWANIRRLSVSMDVPWVVAGDFNAMLQSRDKRGGAHFSRNQNQDFIDCCDISNLSDVRLQGPSFTWYRGLVAERIDRALVNDVWKLRFPNTFVRHLMRLYSDHQPLLFSCSGIARNRLQRNFIFLAPWLGHDGFKDVLKDVWGSAASISEKLARLTPVLTRWNKDVFGNIF
ncbi:hypothetical protein LINPERHAP2_LOCUS36454 [Linum perenne]